MSETDVLEELDLTEGEGIRKRYDFDPDASPIEIEKTLQDYKRSIKKKYGIEDLSPTGMGNAVIRARPGEVDQQVALLDRILERRKIRKEVRDLRKVGIDVTAADLREERFSQAFGKPTGADPFTGRPT